jgi:ATP-dependent Clp protease ATP-binding subunit ClpC
MAIVSLLAWFNKVFRPATASESIRFTPRAKQLLALAEVRARRQGREEISVQDLSVALLEFKEGVAAAILKRLKVDWEVQKAAAKTPASGPWKALLPVAQREQQSLFHQYLGTEHLLLAILQHDSNPVTVLLKERGVTLEKARLEVLKELDPNFEPGT